MVPFTPRGKDNLAGWMVARNDGAEYGKLRVYRLSWTWYGVEMKRLGEVFDQLDRKRR